MVERDRRLRHQRPGVTPYRALAPDPLDGPVDEIDAPDEHAASVARDRDRDRALLASGMTWLARGIAIIAVAIPVSLVDSAVSAAAGLFGPLGALAVAFGVWRIVAGTAETRWGPVLRGLALVAVPLRIATEVGVLLGEVGRAADAEANAPLVLGGWDYIALLTIGATFVGVIALARHLQLALVGVAADRWKQVLYGWGISLVLVPVAVAAGFLELLLVAAAALITASALLLLTVLATYRAAEDDQLELDFPQRAA